MDVNQNKFIPHESILRYYPKDGSPHSTAIMVEDTVVEVKREGQTVRNRYPSVEVWLLSFPGGSWHEVIVSHPGDKTRDEKEDKDNQEQEETPDTPDTPETPHK